MLLLQNRELLPAEFVDNPDKQLLNHVFSTLFYAYDQSDETVIPTDSGDSPRVGLAEVTVIYATASTVNCCCTMCSRF
jgi:hypothetical protein